MHILSIFLNNEIRTGGHRRLLELCEEMAKRGHRVSVFLNSDLAYQPTHFHDIKVECPYIRGKGGSLSKRFKKAVASVPDKLMPEHADLVLIFGETHFKAGRHLSKTLGIPLAYAQRSIPVQENRIALQDPSLKAKTKIKTRLEILVYRIYEYLISKSAAWIIFQSTWDEQDYLSRNRQAEGKTHVIPGHIGEPHYKKKYANINRSTSCRKLIFVGNLWPRKGIRYFIDALCMLKQRGVEGIHADILGPGDWEPWKIQIEKLGLENTVTYHGKIDNPFPMIGRADLIVVPSTFDSFPNSVLEALHTGTPVIGSRTGGIPDMLKYSELLFPVQNSEAIAGIIEKCVKSDEYYKKIGAMCRDRTAQFHFDWTEKWLDVFMKE